MPFERTAPAATIAPSPITQPGKTTAMRPMVTPLPIRTGAVTSRPRSAEWQTRVTSPPMTVSSPISMRFWSAITPVLICTRRPIRAPMSRWYRGRSGVTRTQFTNVNRNTRVSAL